MDRLDQDPLFVALTRPQMFAGVTYSFFVVNGIVSAELFLLFKSGWIVVVALVVHAAGYLACRREPRIFDLWFVGARHCQRIPNHRLWHCNSYSP